MKKEFLFFHPKLMDGSHANKMIWEVIIEKGYKPIDVYSVYPDFKIDVKTEQNRLESADHIYFVFPFYWYSSPALLKEYIDVVWEEGWCWSHKTEAFALKGKTFSFITTLGSGEASYMPGGESRMNPQKFLSWLYETMENLTHAKTTNTICFYQAYNLNKDMIELKFKNL